jgi:hypothetical protein
MHWQSFWVGVFCALTMPSVIAAILVGMARILAQ